MKRPKITRERLLKPDTYRVQMQLESIEDKRDYAFMERFLADVSPDTAKDARDHTRNEAIKQVRRDFRTVWRLNRAKFPRWLERT